MSNDDVAWAYRPAPEEYAWTFGGTPCVRTTAPGDRVRLWTDDAYAGAVGSADDLVSRVCAPGRFNPQTGPFEVTGAAPGDTLVLHLAGLRPARDFGVSAVGPGFGGLVSTPRSPTLQPPPAERTWIWPVDRDAHTVRFAAADSDHRVSLDCAPMLGTIGVAPAGGEARSSLVPDSHGGNLDSPLVRAGTTCYLGVNVAGAAWSLGDGHYRQGDGELCGAGIEGPMDVDVIVDLIPGRATAWPRLETDDTLAVLGSGRPLEEAWRIAHHELVGWIAAETGLSPLDAYQLTSQAVRSPVANAVDPQYTVAAVIDKAALPPLDGSYAGGVHQRLRARARSHPSDLGAAWTSD